MSAALLAKLKIKNEPKQRETVAVVMPEAAPRPDIILKTQVRDKTKQVAFDRKAFLTSIRPKLAVETKKEVIKEERIEEPAATAEPTEVAEVVIKPSVKKVKKIRRLKLVEKQPEDETQVPKKIEEKEKEKETDVVKIKPRKRRTKEPIGVVQEGPASLLVIKDTPIGVRLKEQNEKPKSLIKASSYYMNNREIFVNFMSSLFGPYKQELLDSAKSASCERDEKAAFSPMAHQKIVRDYINLYTPYRGILLISGLGKTKLQNAREKIRYVDTVSSNIPSLVLSFFLRFCAFLNSNFLS